MAPKAEVEPLIDPEVDQDVVLDSLRAFHAEYLRREQGLVLLAVQWARLNPGLKRTLPDGTPNTSPDGVDPEDLLWEELAEKGCPHMDDLTIPAFAVAAGITEFQARKLVRESIMLVYLLPRVWKKASEGQIDVWRARKLAEECWDLTPEAVDYVDRVMSLTTARHTQGGREGAIQEARLRYMPEVVEEEREAAKEERCFNIAIEEWGSSGVFAVWGNLDLPDAVELEKAIAAGAENLKRLGSDAPLDVRRSWALGDLARGSQAGAAELFDEGLRGRRELTGDSPVFRPDCACALGLHPPGRGTPPSQVMMYVHSTSESLARSIQGETGPSPGDAPHSDPPEAVSPRPAFEGTAVPSGAPGVVRIEGTGVPPGTVITPETLRGWLSRPSAFQPPKIIFRPVIDLEDHQHVNAYEVPERLKEHVGLRDGGCVFPWCHRRARRSDCDHTIPWKENGEGGPTCSCNLAPLCRFHHRAKTHADNHVGNRFTWWNYESLGEGKYLWKGPKGTVLLRTNAGVFDVSEDHSSHGPRLSGETTEPRRIEEVTNADATLAARVQAAEAVVRKVSVTLPEHEVEESSEEVLEFPVHKRAPRAPSWRQEAIRRTPEDPPNVKPGSLSDRVLQRMKEEPSALLDALQDYRTECELFSTPDERELRQEFRLISIDPPIYEFRGEPGAQGA